MLTDNMFCTKSDSTTRDATDGDSGGPFVMQGNVVVYACNSYGCCCVLLLLLQLLLLVVVVAVVAVIVVVVVVAAAAGVVVVVVAAGCLLYTSPSPRDRHRSRMPSSA